MVHFVTRLSCGTTTAFHLVPASNHQQPLQPMNAKHFFCSDHVFICCRQGGFQNTGDLNSLAVTELHFTLPVLCISPLFDLCCVLEKTASWDSKEPTQK